jgi:hypothetical protein
MDELTKIFDGADASRPLTDELRSRLEETLLGRSSSVATDFTGIDQARPLPARLQSKLRRRLERRRVAAWQVASAVTAAAAVLIGIVVLPNVARRTVKPPVAIQTTPPGTPSVSSGGLPSPQPTQAPVVGSLPLPSVAGGSSYDPDRGSPPPYAAQLFASAKPLSQRRPGGSGGGTPAAMMPPSARPAPIPARIVVTGADPDISAGFDAYVALVVAQGEVGNRSLDIVRGSAKDALVSVNLGASPVSESSSIPRLETLDVAASFLTGNVFDIASTPRRQARVLAAQILARTDLSGDATPMAVIYRAGGGEFADTVPGEIARVFQDAGVFVLTVDYVPGNTALIPADIAVVSMPPGSARTFVREARDRSYAPRLGLAGIWSLYDDGVREGLGTKVTVVSPYWASSGEFSAIKRGVEARGGRMGAEAIHGWATAKAIASALYWWNPKTPQQMASALQKGIDLVVCPYQLRSGTHERTPDGRVLEGTREGFTAKTGFLADQT